MALYIEFWTTIPPEHGNSAHQHASSPLPASQGLHVTRGHELITCLSALRRRSWWYLHFTVATLEEQGGHTSPHTSSYQLLWSEPGHHSLRGWRQVAPNVWELRGKVLGRGSGPERQSSTASVQSMQALASAALLRQTRPPLEITADAAELFSHKPTLCIWGKKNLQFVDS